VGRVELEYKEQETIVRLDGVECIGLAIYKEADANTVQVVNSVLASLGDLDQDLPDLRFAVVENQARFIEEAVAEVKEAALHGALLAVGVLLFFLRSWTATLVIGLAIPISVLATFTLMYFEDLTLNIMTLGGLALGAGMLVDNAIVVIENIYRHLERGEDARQASTQGANEVGVAIMASTLTTVSVFLPIVYLQGLTSELFKDQAWTVAFSLISSLGVAMLTVPMLTSRFLRKRGGIPTENRWLRFRSFLNGVLNRKGAISLLVVAIVAVTVYVARSIQTEFIPREDLGLFHVDLALSAGSRLELTDRVVQRVGTIIAEVGGDDVAAVYARSGVDPMRLANVGDPTGPNRATLSVALAQGERRSLPQLVEAIDGHLREIPELEVKYQLHETALEGMMGEQAAPIQVELIGDDLDVLRRLTAEFKARVETLPSIYNVSTNFQGGQPELDLRLRVDAVVATGLTVGAIVQTLERRLSGEVIGELAKDQRSRDIRVGFERVDLRELARLRIDAPGGAILALGDLSDPQIVEGPREILREDQRRVGRVIGYLVDGAVLGEAIAQIEGIVADMALPYGYRIEIGGEERERRESFADLKFALILSVVLVYMVMASLFESLLHPFTVMLTVPLAGVGVVWALWSAGEPLSVMAYIGIIMLGGIAVNDSIVLVDRINQLREQLPTVREAVLQGAQDRMRPILMTTATTITALLPMAIGLGEGAGLRAPMAIAVIGGLLSSTLMTLVVIPVVYEAVERLRGERTR
jgi:HAE1 family hydrophobic/amphiphilic exporter-1